MTRNIDVYADWANLEQTTLIGSLNADQIRGKEVFSFSYHLAWLESPDALAIDPRLQLFAGTQYNDDSDRNFRIFLDSCPDRWGRLLMQRREAAQALQQGRPRRTLMETDYLLGVHDIHRMGALRFKTPRSSAFLDNDPSFAAPPLTHLRELEAAVWQIERASDLTDPEYLHWLSLLIAPGSSLGGARPKASVLNGKQLWLAKFPSRHDDYDVGLWEFLIYRLAVNAGIDMAPSDVQQFGANHHTFLTQRFDRHGEQRLHFASAMTLLGCYDGQVGASYLELAQFLINFGGNSDADLQQLWRRMVFNVLVSNTDDHLRNHGFIYGDGGWRLSKAYDLNANPQGTGLNLNINETDNRLDLELVRSVAHYFRLSPQKATSIIAEVSAAVQNWPLLAKQLGIRKIEQQLTQAAFRL
ncbi:type II toxin-antitoxin system HipA family toxin [Pseudidiomarina mangrovi]|uniref:type II toxin-antitoxin system HipA family toxin n=1 Tax=Pseudidiomarina mangrovi TaxID=2487133 RepID=UPI000FCCC87B|nr:HipA domain-containing protein [Pseudidiomarina mangrovi]